MEGEVRPLLEVGPLLAVVGGKGMVGKALVNRFSNLGYKLISVDTKNEKGHHRRGRSSVAMMMWGSKKAKENLKECAVVISATGQTGLIKPEMVKNGVIAIDLGYPKGDFDERVKEKAGFITPVPGGVGPMTVVSLFENLSMT